MDANAGIWLARLAVTLFLIASLLVLANQVRKNGNTGLILMMLGSSIMLLLATFYVYASSIQVLVGGADKTFMLTAGMLLIGAICFVIGFRLTIKIMVSEAKKAKAKELQEAAQRL